MKILIDVHSINQNKTGIERYSANLFLHLEREVHRQKNNSKIIAYTERLSGLSVDTTVGGIYNSRFRNGLFRIIFGLPWATKKIKPNLIHVNFFIPFLTSVPVVVTVHDVCFDYHPELYSWRHRMLFKFFFSRRLSKADAIICVSKTVEKKLLERYSVDKKKIYIVYSGVDKSIEFISNKNLIKTYLRQKYSITCKYFLVVGNIEIRKKPFHTIEAFSKINHSKLALVFVGPDKMNNIVSSRYKDLIDSKRLIILRNANDKDLNMLYNGAIALVYNSYCEGFGLPIVEAMACKLPIICSDIAIFREIASEAGIFFKNIPELTRVMSRVISDSDYRNRHSRLGFVRSKTFSWRKTAQGTACVYKKILKNNQKHNN